MNSALIWLSTVSFLLTVVRGSSSYSVVREYSGQTFFDRWTQFGSWDNLTNGNANFLDQQAAVSERLIYTDGDGRAVIKVDNTSVVSAPSDRNSVRTFVYSYSIGTLWVVDVAHLPFGCSVWPSIWTTGTEWPSHGEIDIIEGVNLMPNNEYSLHANPGFAVPGNSSQTGKFLTTDCSQGNGCAINETAPNSFGEGFAQNGGGVWAAQFDTSGIFIWFWSRGNIPVSILNSTSTSDLSISEWGTPSAAYLPSSTSDIADTFGDQQLVIDITLCGDWAGLGTFYNATCGSLGRTGLCYNDTVIGDGANFDDAFFEINYLRAYSNGVVEPSAAVTGTSTASLNVGSPQNLPTVLPDSSTSGAASMFFSRWMYVVVMGGGIMSVGISGLGFM
ncbi:uncharacterized protein STEHIDRAFT_58644 [Stereum hirsutum FP-91666 SS1]|uniref:uncharacterized protein n=1 Tax=Stereum hirsutum (strain FP-91666) TaxID=721885 RepID=UPI000444A0DA|nr:uncharacterized protein STEHIDRAFT_58644 [Stereum hirsutum FP-91666 SS1]EIM85938.1 hypothetical protein STEHIDRAFT_58644 [Stereum hirsutum FP-91666 SS1]